MKALSLHQPWAYVVGARIKPVENRSWKPWPEVVGQRIAIHATKTWDKDGEAFIRRIAPNVDLDDVHARAKGAIIGVVTITGAMDFARPSIIDPPELTRSPWFVGPWGWTLKDALLLPEPVPCRGFQMLWELPSDIAMEVRRALASRSGAEAQT